MQDVNGAVSTQEAQFDQWRRRTGLFAAPVVLLVLWWLPTPGLDLAAHRLLAVFGLVVTLWITEAIPLAITALLGPALCVVCGVSGEKEMFRSFGHPIIFLFLGSFLLAQGMLRHGLNHRIAFGILGLRWVGQSPARILVAFGSITCLLSMWISNTTATAMMFPIALAILGEMARQQSQRAGHAVSMTELRFGTGLLLTAAFASSIGGMATPVGTPPNLIGISQIEKAEGVRLTFFQWMAFGVPLALVLTAVLVIYLNRACPAEAGVLSGGTSYIEREKSRLGPLSQGEKNVLLAFAVTVGLWLLPGVLALVRGTSSPTYQWLGSHLPEGVAALIGATLLFVLPTDFARGEFTLGWSDAMRIDWGTILLFGGGLAIGDAMFSTGLAEWMGKGLVGQLHITSTLGLIVLFGGLGVLFTETTSNTATANMVVPVAIAVSKAAGVEPLQPALAACLGASLAFMLPVSTPPNAIVFGSGCVPILKMVRHGLVLDLAGLAGIVVTVYWLVPLIIR